MNLFTQNLKNNRKWYGLIVFLLIAIPAGLFIQNEYWQFLMVVFLLSCIYTMSLNLIMGYAGQFAISNPAFMAIGAYVTAVLVMHFGWYFWPSVVFMLLVAFVVSVAVGYITLRFTSGIYLNIITLAIVGLTLLIIKHPLLAPYTGGVNGLTTDYKIGVGSILLESNTSWYFFLLVISIMVFLLSYRLVKARTGRAWVALRENEQLARSLGINPTYYKTLAYVISSLIAAFAGSLAAPFFKFISEGSFNIEVAIIQCVTLAVGGFGTLAGPIIGSAVFTVVPELLRPIAELRIAIFGLILILVMLFLPGGLYSFIRLYLREHSRTKIQNPLSELFTKGHAPVASSNTLALQISKKLSADKLQTGQILLEINGVGKTYGGLKALSDVDCQVRKGEILGLIGPNGAGKSTLLKILSGFEESTAGRVSFCGEDISGASPEQLCKRGIVRTFQEVGVFPELTVFDHMLISRHLEGKTGLFFDLFGGRRVRKIDEANLETLAFLLHLCGLEEQWNTMGKNLSYGEMKKLSIAMALAVEPKLLLLDEATAGLSAEETTIIAQVIRGINDLGVTIIVIEHNVPFISALTHRILVLDLGQKIAEGMPDVVLNDPRVVSAYIGG